MQDLVRSLSHATHVVQRRRRHFKSGQATTANKRSLVHVHGGGRRAEGLQQAMCGSKNYLWNQNAAIKENILNYNPAFPGFIFFSRTAFVHR